MGNMNKSDNNTTVKNFLLAILFLLLLAIPAYFAYTILFPRVEIFEQEQEEVQEENDIQKKDVEEEQEEVSEGPHYEELYETIEGQAAYIAVPTQIDEENPPRIIVYSHGSNTIVSSNTEDEFMQDLQVYGEELTKENYIFAASNQHGANWGNDDSIQDTLNMIDSIEARYPTEEKINMIGYSMGGLPTMNFASEYPEMVNKIALLAPTTRPDEWDAERVEQIEDIEIKIWHGTADVNVGYSLSTTFVNKLDSLGKEVELVTLDGKTHWDIHTEYIEDILTFFN